jgi:hypothetical protein
MSHVFAVRGQVPEVIRNDEGLYEGNLIHYARIIFRNAQNLLNPYHNFRHMLHVAWLCWNACRYYQLQLTSRQRRNLMIAALFHDFDHPGKVGQDDLNIERAIRALDKYILPEDRPHFEDIAGLIRATEYPHQGETVGLELRVQILRDADVMQGFSVAWIQQILGFAAEWQKTPAEVLLGQTKFFQELKLSTEWAQKMCPPTEFASKMQEIKELIEIFLGE